MSDFDEAILTELKQRFNVSMTQEQLDELRSTFVAKPQPKHSTVHGHIVHVSGFETFVSLRESATREGARHFALSTPCQHWYYDASSKNEDHVRSITRDEYCDWLRRE